MQHLKTLLIVVIMLSVVISSLTSCDQIDAEAFMQALLYGEQEPDANPDNTPDNTPDDTPDNTPDDKPEDKPTDPKPLEDKWAEEYDCITIARALELCEGAVEAPTKERYYIIATVKSVDNDSYGQLTIEDETGSIMVYGTQSSDGSVRYDAMQDKPVAGDLVLIYGTLQNYNGNTKEVQSAWLIDFYSPDGSGETPTVDVKPGDTITIAKALEIAGLVSLEDRFYIRATVSSITNPTYGAMTIEDETGSISVYNSQNADGTVGYADMEDKPYKGDSVLLYCSIQNFNGTKEIKSAYIVEFTHEEVKVNENDYTAMSIADARDAKDGALVKVSGVVARITYADGYKPSGLFLIDGTNSIYVYDGDLAGMVKAGNKITILGAKDHWILASEEINAAKFGYAGCNQITDVYLLENDGLTNAYDKSWITETTVKEIVDTPVTTDITSTVFKVTALVNKVVGTGYVNYYINDLDGETGSYTYSQCSGGDFSWIDEFDGKICTVYLTAINAKSTASGCFWRFIPIEIVDEGFVFDTDKAPEHAVKYYGIGQFLPAYTADPALELITSVSSELLGFENVVLSYSSDNESVVYFTTANGKTVMHCGEYGTATVTVKAEYNGVGYTETVTVTNSKPVDYEFISVEDAIAKAVGETVTVKGIVGPSLVNKVGFYLMGENGLIAVLTDSATMATVELGHEVILQGVRHINTKGGTTYYGQTCIKDAVVLVNNLGNHEYNDDYFVTDKSLADLYNLDPTVDYTTTVFVTKATVKYEGTAYYTKLDLVDGDTTFGLYMSGAAQYEWLQQFAGQEITLEIAACNWNDKTFYRGCVLSVILADGTKVYNTLNFDTN